MAPKVLPVHHSCSSHLSSQDIQMINWAKNNLSFSIFVGVLLWLLHRQYENNRGSVRKPCGFDALMISVMFCFTGATGALLIRNKPQLAKLRRGYFVISMVAMASTLSILAFALLSESFRLVSLGSILWQNESREDNNFFISSYLSSSYVSQVLKKINGPVCEDLSKVI